jgi:hypothetical protein
MLLVQQVLLGDHIKVNKMGGACATQGEKINLYRMSVGKPEGKNHFADLGEDGRIILKQILRE